MIHADNQEAVDAFIFSAEPKVPRTKSPIKSSMETVYTRLRNELAHRRVGTNIESTKSEMTARLNDLIALTKRAIELYP